MTTQLPKIAMGVIAGGLCAFSLSACGATSGSNSLLSAPVEEVEDQRDGIDLIKLVSDTFPFVDSLLGQSTDGSSPYSAAPAPGQVPAQAAPTVKAVNVLPAAVPLTPPVGVTTAGAPTRTQAAQQPLGSQYRGDFSRFGPGPNVHLWRAALEIVNFMPMALADPITGLIQTGWHTAPSNANQRLRIEVYVLSDQLREDALRVNVYAQMRQGGGYGQWVNAPVNPTTARQLEARILARALERQASGRNR